jgi:hypothetical protein
MHTSAHPHHDTIAQAEHVEAAPREHLGGSDRTRAGAGCGAVHTRRKKLTIPMTNTIDSARQRALFPDFNAIREAFRQRYANLPPAPPPQPRRTFEEDLAEVRSRRSERPAPCTLPRETWA